jgi:type II secretory pathway pseudopilin PulG
MMSRREQPWSLRARHGQSSRSAGFTFAELLLVLALLLVISGLVLPPVMRMMADQPLKEAAERTRSQIANVRLKALDSSAAWQFRFEPGGRHYLWTPQELNSSSANGNGSGVASNSAVNPINGPFFGELPKGIQFLTDINGVPLAVERLPQAMVAGLSNGYEMAQVGWSAPMTFQPDGSAMDFELAVQDARDRQIRLSVRGFTGGVTVSSIENRRR